MPFHCLAIECFNGFLSMSQFRKLRECKAARSSRIEIADHLHDLHFETVLFDPDLKFIFASLMGKVSNIQPCHCRYHLLFIILATTLPSQDARLLRRPKPRLNPCL
jgi:hypothetical protein